MRFWTGFNPWVRRNAGCWDSDKHCWSSACPLRAPVLTEGWLSFAVLFVMSVSLCMLYKHKCPHKYYLIIKLNRRVLFWRVKFRWGWRARRGQHLFERERETAIKKRRNEIIWKKVHAHPDNSCWRKTPFCAHITFYLLLLLPEMWDLRIDSLKYSRKLAAGVALLLCERNVPVSGLLGLAGLGILVAFCCLLQGLFPCLLWFHTTSP